MVISLPDRAVTQSFKGCPWHQRSALPFLEEQMYPKFFIGTNTYLTVKHRRDRRQYSQVLRKDQSIVDQKWQYGKYP